MRMGSDCIRWAARVVLLAILWVAIAPDGAPAHEGGHAAPAASEAGDGRALAGTVAGSLPGSIASPPCAPGPNHGCSCENDAALLRADQGSLVSLEAGQRPAPRLAGSRPYPIGVAPNRKPPPSPASPRAPPRCA